MMKVLLVDLLPYERSTRTRKVGAQAATRPDWQVEALTFDRVGRVGLRSTGKGRLRVDGVDVRQVTVREPSGRRDIAGSVVNLLLTYPWPLAKLAGRAIRTPADAIFVGHVALFWVGIAHSLLHGSRVVLNGRERPGGVRTKGSLGTAFSRLEPMLLRGAARHRQVSMVAVCDSHAADFARLGFSKVVVARNVPRAGFSEAYEPLPATPWLTVACVGSLYAGRGIEPLIDAVVLARSRGMDFRLAITGFASAEYADALRSRIANRRAEDFIALEGPCGPDEVPAVYRRAHVGTALYEAVDAANDSLSNKIFESVVSGRPVLAGSLPENARLVGEAGIGWVADVDAESLAAVLSEVWAQRATLESLAQHCHEYGRVHFAWEKEVQPVLDLIEGQ